MNLHVHEAVYNPNSDICLLSKYQIREHGIAVDSVANKHCNHNRTYGTQMLYATDEVQVHFVNRGGLMGLVVYPFEEGDEEYETFDITCDYPWKPKMLSTNIPFHQAT